VFGETLGADVVDLLKAYDKKIAQGTHVFGTDEPIAPLTLKIVEVSSCVPTKTCVADTKSTAKRTSHLSAAGQFDESRGCGCG
jgi:hypothetical protein